VGILTPDIISSVLLNNTCVLMVSADKSWHCDWH